MSYLLGINTATFKTEICLLKNNVSIDYLFWENDQNESEKLIPAVSKMLADANILPADLKKVFLVNGPGSFVAIRLAVVLANSLAQNNGSEIFSMSTFEYLSRCHTGASKVLLNAGGQDIYNYDCKSREFEVVKYLELDSSELSNPKNVIELKQNPDINFDSRKKLNNVIIDIVNNQELDDLLQTVIPLSPNYIKQPSITIK